MASETPSWRDCTIEGRYIWYFTNPHRQKSHEVKPGDQRGQSSTSRLVNAQETQCLLHLRHHFTLIMIVGTLVADVLHCFKRKLNECARYFKAASYLSLWLFQKCTSFFSSILLTIAVSCSTCLRHTLKNPPVRSVANLLSCILSSLRNKFIWNSTILSRMLCIFDSWLSVRFLT